MIDSDEAVSEVLGMILMVSISIIAIGSIMVVGVPMIESGKNRAKMDVAANSFLTLQNDIEEVARGPIWVVDPKNITDIGRIGPARRTDFELMGGTITVQPSSTNIACQPVNCTPVNGSLNITIPPSNITYVSDLETIAYENGAVIRKYEAGIPIMTSYPLISIYNTGDNGTAANSSITISIHAIILNSTLSSAGGEGKAWIETRLNNYSLIVEPQGTPNVNQTNIRMYSRYPDAWYNFFKQKLDDARLVEYKGYSINITPRQETSPGQLRQLNIQINGTKTGNTSDIFLAVYETRLDVKVR